MGELRPRLSDANICLLPLFACLVPAILCCVVTVLRDCRGRGYERPGSALRCHPAFCISWPVRITLYERAGTSPVCHFCWCASYGQREAAGIPLQLLVLDHGLWPLSGLVQLYLQVARYRFMKPSDPSILGGLYEHRLPPQPPRNLTCTCILVYGIVRKVDGWILLWLLRVL